VATSKEEEEKQKKKWREQAARVKMWGNPAFVGHFANAIGTEMTVDDLGKEVFQSENNLQKLSLRTLLQMLDLTLTRHQEELTRFNEKQIKAARAAANELKKALGFLESLSVIKKNADDSNLAKFIQDWIDKIEELEVGETAVWTHTKFYFVITREEDSKQRARKQQPTYSLDVCTTSGDALGYHPVSMKWYPKTKHQTTITLPQIAQAPLLENAFWSVSFHAHI
jgi:hypothetical protein